MVSKAVTGASVDRRRRERPQNKKSGGVRGLRKWFWGGK